MNPLTHKRGAPPDFALPRPNPNPGRMTDALWWLVCMREALEPTNSENGGTFANKPGFHNAGENLPGHGAGGQGKASTDHSIRDSFNRTGPWWLTKTSAHDWTFWDAQRGDFKTIKKYTNRLIKSMKDPNDLRPDDVYAYTLGQGDDDSGVEGYNERDNEDESSSDKTHNWHRHDSFRRNIIGNFWAMWKALTIDMGWTYAEWLKSTERTDMADINLNQSIKDPIYGNRNVGTFIKDIQGLRDWLIGDKAGGDDKPIAASPLGRLDAMLAEWPKIAELIKASVTAETTRDTVEAAAAASRYSELLDELRDMPVSVSEALIGGTDQQTADVLTKLLGDRAAAVIALMQSSSGN